MAVIDFVGVMSEINLSYSVGAGGVNQKGDVMAVQALMRYALPGRQGFHKGQLSIPDGVIGPKTMKAIKDYQRYLRIHCNQRISVDGRIDPGKGSIMRGRKLNWTIRMLNSHALDRYNLDFYREGDGNFLNHFFRKYPQVKAVIPNPQVGSLNLALE